MYLGFRASRGPDAAARALASAIATTVIVTVIVIIIIIIITVIIVIAIIMGRTPRRGCSHPVRGPPG